MSIADRGLLFFASISLEERRRIGVHTCPGTDLEPTHSADIDYAELLPSLFELKAGNFYIALPKPDQRIFVGIMLQSPPHIETPAEVRDRSFEPGKNWNWWGETVNF